MFSLAAGSPPKTTGVIYHVAERFLAREEHDIVLAVPALAHRAYRLTQRSRIAVQGVAHRSAYQRIEPSGES